MNISLKNNEDGISAVLTMEVVKDDYAGLVEQNLRKFRRQANIPGFRKGMVPMGMIKKMYGKQVLVEDINKLVSEKLYDYLSNNSELAILGDPLPSETEQKKIDFDTQEDFEFCFDIALTPKITVEPDANDKLTYYRIVIEEEKIEERINSYRSNYGKQIEVDTIEEKDQISGVATEWENDAPKEGGMVVEDAHLILGKMNEEEKKKFIGAEKGSTVLFNPVNAFGDDRNSLKAFLKTQDEEAAAPTGDFRFEIKEIFRLEMAALDQVLFDKVLGENIVTDEEGFRNMFRQSMAEPFDNYVDLLFLKQLRDLLLKKAGEVAFADNILRRWLLISNEKYNEETLEKAYPHIIEDLTFELIKEHIIKNNDLKVMEEDIDNLARKDARIMFLQYGMIVSSDKMLDHYLNSMLEDKNKRLELYNQALNGKLVEWAKGKSDTEIKDVTVDEFVELIKNE